RGVPQARQRGLCAADRPRRSRDREARQGCLSDNEPHPPSSPLPLADRSGRVAQSSRPDCVRAPSSGALTLEVARASCGSALRYDIWHSMRQGPSILDTLSMSARRAPMAADEKDDGLGVGEGEGQVGVATRTRARSKKPSQYKVLMLNDDYTPMEFVVMVLKRFFRMDLEQATRVMLHVHQRGVGVCGIFPYEVAETKVNQVMDFARENQHPLQCTLEKA